MQRWFRLEGKKQNTLFWVRWPRYPGQVTCLSSDVMMMSFRNPRCCRFVVMSPQTGAHMSCYFYVKPGTCVHTASGLKGPIKNPLVSMATTWSWSRLLISSLVSQFHSHGGSVHCSEDSPSSCTNFICSWRKAPITGGWGRAAPTDRAGLTVILTGNVKMTKFSSVFLNWSARAVPVDVSTPFSSRLTWQFHVSEVKYNFVVLFSSSHRLFRPSE